MDTTFQDIEKRFKKLEIIAELAARIPYQDEKDGGMLVGAIEYKAMLKALVEAGIVPQTRKLWRGEQ